MVFLKLLAVMFLGIALSFPVLFVLNSVGIHGFYVGLLTGFGCTLGLQMLLADWIFDY